MSEASDLELLKAAAKAAGIDMVNQPYSDSIHVSAGGLSWKTWNPLANDGDAFRLAVKLNLDVDICFSTAAVCYVFTNTAGDEDADNVAEPTGDDAAAATRRAIVRAAAAIAAATGSPS